ncbi:MAG: shikimate kinase [Oscillospiraceae bacterium]|nr:shikimate kinase [Oscillospiraceae bacterium]
MNIVLTGFMASGKTEISKAIAEISKYTLVDTDDLITQKLNMSINEIFDKYGEEYFRKVEHEAVLEAAKSDNAVIATGGGVVLNKANIDALRETGLVFNLSPDFSVIKERLEEARKTRPLLRHDSIENIEKRFNDRKPFYDNCDYKIHIINGRTPRSYAMEILNIVEDNT